MDIARILAGIESEIDRLQRVANALRGIKSKPSNNRGIMSAAARRKISLAQEARWATVKAKT